MSEKLDLTKYTKESGPTNPEPSIIVNVDEAMELKGQGVYILRGFKTNESDTRNYELRMLYVGKSKDFNTRMKSHINGNSNFRKNLNKLDYAFCTNMTEYEEKESEGLEAVLIKEVEVYHFGNTAKDFLGIDLLEVLLIHDHEPFFNVQFSVMSRKEKEEDENENNQMVGYSEENAVRDDGLTVHEYPEE